MNIALLFNSDDPKYDGFYGDPIKESVFGLGLIQSDGRHMIVSVGDVLIYSHSSTWDEYDSLTQRTYYSNTWSLLLDDRLRATFRRCTVYALTFHNMTEKLALKLHTSLTEDQAYLGAMEVKYTYGPHLALFRNMMISRYRVQGDTCRLFYSMSEEDGKDIYDADAMRLLGYNDVDWEDRGAHHTIFDNYDTLEHFEQIEDFQAIVAPFLPDGKFDACELTMVLEDLNPRLFNILGSAAVALNRARHEEDVAQAAISGRRFIEKLADALFPAKVENYNGRIVNQAKYKNRLWAYISDNINDETRVSCIGKEVERLDEEFNAGLHGDRDKGRILKAFCDVAILTRTLLELNPKEARKPYYAFEKEISDFLKNAFKV